MHVKNKAISVLSAAAVLFFVSGTVRAEVTLEETLSSRVVSTGGELELALTLNWEDETDAVEIKNILPPSSASFRLVSAREKNRTIINEGGESIQKKVFTYRFLAKEKGAGTFTPFRVEYVLKDHPEDVQSMTGSEISVDIVSPGAIFRQKLIAAALPFFSICLILCMAVWVLIIFRKKPAQSSDRKSAETVIEKGYTERIQSLSSESVQNTDDGTFHALDTIIKDYVREKYQVRLDDLRDITTRSQCAEDTELVSLCNTVGDCLERVSFGGYTVSSAEGKRILKNCEKYFRKKSPKDNPESGLRLRGEI